MAANPSNTIISPFSAFSDASLCIALRQQLSIFLIPHSNPVQHIFSSEQIRRLLIEVFRFREYEVSYQMMKVIGFGKDKWCKLEIEEMINFIVQEIVGRNISKDGKMNEEQFIESFVEGVSFLKDFNVNQYKNTLRILFKELQPQNGTISHKSYFLFLRFYCGSQSPFIQHIPFSPPMELSISRELQTPIKNQFGSSFKDVAHAEIEFKLKQYDRQGKGSLAKKEIEDFMYDVLQLERNAIGFVIGTFFTKQNIILGVPIPTLIELICQIHFSQVITTILKKQTRKDSPSDIKLPSHLFFSLLQDNCFFFRAAPSKQLLLSAFNQIRSLSMELDSNVINLGDMRNWVMQKLCNGRTRKSLSQLGSRGGRSNRIVPPSQSILQAQSSQMQEDQSTVSKQKKQQIINQKISSGGSKIIIQTAPLSDIRSQRYVAPPASSNHEFSSQRNIEVQVKHDVRQKSQIQSSISTSKPVINIIPAPSILSKHSQGSTLTPSITFKQSLWNKVFSLLGDFTFTDISMLRKQETLQFMKSNLKNHQYLNQLLLGVQKMYTFQHEQHFQVLASYIIHFCGESSLRTFNKKAVKGKCMLTDFQLAEVLKEAYSWLWNGDFEGLAREMLDQNGKDAMGYKNYLQFIGRNLSVQNTF